MAIDTWKLSKLIIGMALSVHGATASTEVFEPRRNASLTAAFALYEAGRFNQALEQLRPHAERGDPRAQLVLATLYRTGTGTEADEYEAAMWYKRAAQQGVAEAQFHIGLMYLKGVGVTENSVEALEWISRAAGQGYGDAQDVFSYILNSETALAC